MAFIETFVSVIGEFVSAVIAGILIRRWLNHHYRPILVIDGNASINIRSFHLLDPAGMRTTFWANRIRVRNAGRSAAKDCKAYVCYIKTDIRRTAWLIRNKESGYTQTLNVRDREYVDLCCISDDGQIRIIPAEHGYDQVNRFDAYVHLEQKWGEITVRITSSNAEPIERKVKLHRTVDHFAKQRGRIVEFLYDDPPLDHMDDALPEEYQKCLVGITAIMKEAWDTATAAAVSESEREVGGSTNSRRDKLQALSLAKECYAMKLDLLSSATVVDRAVRFVDSHKRNTASDNSSIAGNDAQISNYQTMKSSSSE